MAPNLHIFGLEVPSYSLMILCGFAGGLLVAMRRTDIYGFRKDEILASYFLAGIGAFFGGKLFFVMQGLPQFLELHETKGTSFFEYFSSAGLVFYGGMIGTLACIFLAARLFRVPSSPLLDTLLPSLPLAQAFGRVGCFLAGCCYGMPSDFGFFMHPDGFAPTDEKLLPIQLLEAAAVGILFLVLLHLGRRPVPKGRLLGIYLFGYGCLRFILEFFRGDEVRGHAGIFSISQWISIGCVAAGLLLLRLSFTAPVPRYENGTCTEKVL